MTVSSDETVIPRKKPQPILAAAALTSGVALVASIILEVSLALTLILLSALALCVIVLKWSSSTSEERIVIRAQLVTGLISGILATLAYDVTRMLLVTLGQFHIWPFDTFKTFGELIIGNAPETARLVVGTFYHFGNGISFAVAYCLLLGSRHWMFGVGWGLALEAMMLTIYPGWLDLQAVIAEFFTMSVLGHVAYGSVLGFISQRRLRNWQMERKAR
jgi:hypothetical protein